MSKQLLFTIRGGETLQDIGGYIEGGTIYIIIESEGKCKNGTFAFHVNT